jgi:hypothetical protein
MGFLMTGNSLPIIMVKWINPTGAMQSDLNNPKG